MALLTNSECNADVKKKGYLLKIKTAKKKLFILHDESSSGPARLEYYDNAKKFKSGAPSRRSIVLRSCFSINAKSDNPRYPFAIVLYTTDDCFVIGCESDCERQDWLKALLELRRPGHCSASSHAGSGFRHVWPVTVHSSTRGSTEETLVGRLNVPSGEYRLCMSPASINLQSADGQRELLIPAFTISGWILFLLAVLGFLTNIAYAMFSLLLRQCCPSVTNMSCARYVKAEDVLNSIRCCGHGDQSVYVEVCQQSTAGLYKLNHLLVNAEDAIIAQSIHDTLVNLLNSSVTLRTPFRSRAHTSVDHAQRRNALQRRDAPVSESPCSSVSSALYWSSLTTENTNGHPVTDKLYIDDEYMVMSTPTDEGYLDMSATYNGSLNTGVDLKSRLDVVQSFVVVNETDFNSSDDEMTNNIQLPKRAYSVGSKPLSASHAVMGKHKVDVVSTTKSSSPEGLVEIETGIKSVEEDLACTRSSKANLKPSEVTNKNVEYGDELSEVRPRTSTFPWDLLRSRACVSDCLDAPRPRSVSNGNWMQIRDKIEAVKRRLSNGARGLSAAAGDVDNHLYARESPSSADCEYVEMKSNNIDYVDMTFGSHAKR